MMFRLLGRVEAEWRGRRIVLGRRRERCLLALLLLEAGTVVGTERLLDLLWEGTAGLNARAQLHSHVSRLRKALLGDETVQLVARDGGYLIDVEPETVDVHRFRALVADGRARRDPAERSAMLREALALWRGPVMADTASDRLRDLVAGDLAELRLLATELAIEAELDQGRHDEVIGELLAITVEHPLRERLTSQLMLALYRAGRQPDALAVYHRLRIRLADELGVDPSPELRDRYTAVLRHDTGLFLDEPFDRSVPPAQLPAVTAHFVGREAALATLHGSPVSVVRGMPGVGKTALAVYWAHLVADRFPDGQLFVDLRGYSPGAPRQPAEVLEGFLTALGVPRDRIPRTEAEMSARYRTSLAGKKVLVVLDNAGSAEQVRPLLPGSNGSVTVITSRSDLGGLVATHDALLVPLDVLAEQDAERLLTGVIGPVSGDEPAAVRELAQLCGYLPLALRIAAAKVISDGQPVADVVTRLRDGNRLSGLAFHGDPQVAVRAALESSYRALDPLARTLFRRLGLAPGDDATPPVAASLLDTSLARTRPVLARLVSAHLAREHHPGRYRLHDLVRDYAREVADVEESKPDRLASVERALEWYLHTACRADQALTPMRPHPEPGSPAPTTCPPLAFTSHSTALAWCDAEESNLIAAVRAAAEHELDGIAWRIPVTLGYFSVVRLTHPDWIDCYHTGYACARRCGELVGEAWTAHGLGVALANRRRFTEAMEHLLQAAALFREVGLDWAVGSAYVSLGCTCRDAGHFAEAFDHFGRSSDIYAEAGMRWGVGVVRLHEGDTHRYAGRLDEALACYQESFDIAVEYAFPWGLAINLMKIGDIHRLLGRPGEAMTHYQRALPHAHDSGDRAGEAHLLDLCGQTAHDLARPDDAVTQWTAALAIYDELDDPRAAQLRIRLEHRSVPVQVRK
ncbi:AfsR/SARP family transcriptional regulator [Kibdelosporangium aridum]|uniref:AfsR/SARP family transcriptional regulator n=2 Tax=Kibdelosporangium aridum TaxID=2030 RepID=A0A428Y897_KIBAR|nr:AfsR/SARP family transcriptional regulator [Kibdelosporangium aridum]